MEEISIVDKIFLDTNALLNYADRLNELDKIYISSISLEELEEIKTSSKKDEETKFLARKAVRYLLENQDKLEVVPLQDNHYGIVESKNLKPTNDNLIIACAVKENTYKDVVFVTDDLLCRIFAKNFFNLRVEQVFSDDEEHEYKGYREFFLDIGNEGDEKWLASLYENPEINPCDLYINEYLIIRDKKENKTIDKFRWDGKKLTNLKLPPKRIVNPLNDLQACALDLLMDKEIPIKIITGVYGSGKTKLSTLIGLYLVEEKEYYPKLVLVRNNDLNDSGKDVGALPGDLLDKTSLLFQTSIQHFPQVEYQAERMRNEGKLDTLVTYFIKGLSISGFMIVDEAEDLTLKDIKLVGSRIEKDGCIVFSGDWKQASGKYKDNNGLIQLMNKTKNNPLVGVVVLDEDVRSDASKVFADLM